MTEKRIAELKAIIAAWERYKDDDDNYAMWVAETREEPAEWVWRNEAEADETRDAAEEAKLELDKLENEAQP